MFDAIITIIEKWHEESKTEYKTKVAHEEETDYSDAMDSIERAYAEGYMDALSSVIELLNPTEKEQ
jgi:hypothetical protein